MRDFNCVQVIDNKAGQLCSNYPSELVVIEGHLNQQTKSPARSDMKGVSSKVVIGTGIELTGIEQACYSYDSYPYR